jgi:hypothetical protein
MNLAYGQTVAIHPISNRTHDVQVRQEDNVAQARFLTPPDWTEILSIQSIRGVAPVKPQIVGYKAGKAQVSARAPLPSAYRPLPTALHALAP